MELEELVHRPQRGVVDLFEVEGRVDLGGHALQELELGRPAGELRGLARELARHRSA